MKLSNTQRTMLEALIRKSDPDYLKMGLSRWIHVEPCEWDDKCKTLGSLLRNGLIRAKEHGPEDSAQDMKPGDKFTWRYKSYWVSITAKGIETLGKEYVKEGGAI